MKERSWLIGCGVVVSVLLLAGAALGAVTTLPYAADFETDTDDWAEVAGDPIDNTGTGNGGSGDSLNIANATAALDLTGIVDPGETLDAGSASEYVTVKFACRPEATEIEAGDVDTTDAEVAFFINTNTTLLQYDLVVNDGGQWETNVSDLAWSPGDWIAFKVELDYALDRYYLYYRIGSSSGVSMTGDMTVVPAGPFGFVSGATAALTQLVVDVTGDTLVDDVSIIRMASAPAGTGTTAPVTETITITEGGWYAFSGMDNFSETGSDNSLVTGAMGLALANALGLGGTIEVFDGSSMQTYTVVDALGAGVYLQFNTALTLKRHMIYHVLGVVPGPTTDVVLAGGTASSANEDGSTPATSWNSYANRRHGGARVNDTPPAGANFNGIGVRKPVAPRTEPDELAIYTGAKGWVKLYYRETSTDVWQWCRSGSTPYTVAIPADALIWHYNAGDVAREFDQDGAEN